MYLLCVCVCVWGGGGCGFFCVLFLLFVFSHKQPNIKIPRNKQPYLTVASQNLMDG